MPTTRARHQITETDEIAAAIDRAAEVWPNESRSDLLRHLVTYGAERLASSPIERMLEVELALHELTKLTDGYPSDFLHELRKDWEGRSR